MGDATTDTEKTFVIFIHGFHPIVSGECTKNNCIVSYLQTHAPMVWIFPSYLVSIGHVRHHVHPMDAVSGQKSLFTLTFWVGVGVAFAMGIFQEWLGFAFYNEKLQAWVYPFNHPALRFGIRELVVYVNLFTGFYCLKKAYPNTPLPQFFAIITIAIDLVFIGFGLLRLIFPTFSIFTNRYGELFYYLATGILFVFFYGLGKGWHKLSQD